MPTRPPLAAEPKKAAPWRRVSEAARHSRDAFRLVWDQSPRLALALPALSVGSGGLPAVIAYLAKLLIDAAARPPDAERVSDVVLLLGLELGAVVLLLGLERCLALCDALLRVKLAQGILERVLARTLTLELSELEDPELRDELRLVTEHASERPLNLARRALVALQQAVTLLGIFLLLAGFSAWLLGLLLVATAPALWAELRLNADAFRLFRAQSSEARRQRYLETVLTSDLHAKELLTYGTGPSLLARHRTIFEQHYAADRALSMRRALWSFAVGVGSALALTGCYVWITWNVLGGTATVGALAMLFVVLRQAQSSSSALVSVLAGMHHDQLYMAALQRFLARSPARPRGDATSGPVPGDGIRFVNVSFRYAGSSAAALKDVTFHLPPGVRVSIVGENGAGKTTLLKLLVGLYRPSAGQVTLDGLPLESWQPAALQGRLAVVFQDFGRYQLLAGENIGIGSASALDDRARWRAAAEAALVAPLLASLPQGFETQLGTWFHGGRDLSTGEWQRLALARAFTKPKADIVVLDEPTASVDAIAEAALLAELTESTRGRLAILISHRATWSDPASLIARLERGRLTSFGPRRDERAE